MNIIPVFLSIVGKNGLPGAYKVMNVPNELLQEKNYGENGLYLLEQVDWRNNYEGNNLLSAGYVGVIFRWAN